MEKLKVFRTRTYGYNELATLYSPDVTTQAAVKRLTRWLEQHPSLRSELEQTGWQRSDRLLTPIQVGIIVNHLGEP